jgi:phage terminase small subunit
MPRGDLTDMQERFVAEYLVDLNATQAAIRAGYSEATARQQGPRLLANVVVSAAIAARFAKQQRRIDLNAENVTFEGMRVCFSDVGNYYRDDGMFMAIKDMSPDARAALQAVETHERYEADGTVRVVVRKVKLHPKVPAIELMMRRLRLLDALPPEMADQDRPKLPDYSRLSGKHLRWIAEINAILSAPVWPPKEIEGSTDGG